MKTERIIIAALPSSTYLPWVFLLLVPIYLANSIIGGHVLSLIFMLVIAAVAVLTSWANSMQDENSKTNSLADLEKYSPKAYKYFVDVGKRLGISELEWKYYVDPKLSSPRVYGLSKKGSIVLPKQFIDNLMEQNNKDKINEAIVLHEISHLLRQDHFKIVVLEFIEKFFNSIAFIATFVTRWSIVIIPPLVAALFLYRTIIDKLDLPDSFVLFLLALSYLLQLFVIIKLNHTHYFNRKLFSNRFLFLISAGVFFLDLMLVNLASFEDYVLVILFLFLTALVVITTLIRTFFRLFRYAIMRAMEFYADSLVVDFQGTSEHLESALLKFSVLKYRSSFGLGLTSEIDAPEKNSRAKTFWLFIQDLFTYYTRTHPSVKERIKSANTFKEFIQNNSIEIIVGGILPVFLFANFTKEVDRETSLLICIFIPYMCLSIYSTSILLLTRNNLKSILLFYIKKMLFILAGVLPSTIVFSLFVFLVTGKLVLLEFILVFLIGSLFVLLLLMLNTLFIRELMSCYKIEWGQINPTIHIICLSLYTFFMCFFVFVVLNNLAQGNAVFWQIVFGIIGIIAGALIPRAKIIHFLIYNLKLIFALVLVLYIAILMGNNSFVQTFFGVIGVSICTRVTMRLADLLKKHRGVCPSCNSINKGHYTLEKKCNTCEQTLNENFVVISKNVLASETRYVYNLVRNTLIKDLT